MEGSEEPSAMKIETDKASAEAADGSFDDESLVSHGETTVDNGEISNGPTEENDSNGFVRTRVSTF